MQGQVGAVVGGNLQAQATREARPPPAAKGRGDTQRPLCRPRDWPVESHTGCLWPLRPPPQGGSAPAPSPRKPSHPSPLPLCAATSPLAPWRGPPSPSVLDAEAWQAVKGVLRALQGEVAQGEPPGTAASATGPSSSALQALCSSRVPRRAAPSRPPGLEPLGSPTPNPPISLPTQHLHLQGGSPGPVPLPPAGLPTTQGFCLYLPMQDQIEIKPIPGITTPSTMWPWAHLTPSRTQFAHVPKQLQGIQHGPSAAIHLCPHGVFLQPCQLPLHSLTPGRPQPRGRRPCPMCPPEPPLLLWPVLPHGPFPLPSRGWPGLRGCSDALFGFRKGSRRAAGAKAVGRG